MNLIYPYSSSNNSVYCRQD